MYIGSQAHPSQGYFSWSCKLTGEPNDETPAPDGEEYFAMALYFASNRWGNGAGIYDYKARADELLTAMRHRDRRTGATKFGVRTVGAGVDQDAKMIRFTRSKARPISPIPAIICPPFTSFGRAGVRSRTASSGPRRPESAATSLRRPQMRGPA